MADINSLPSEILVQIFHYYIQSDTQLNFMNCVSNVCKKWQEVCKSTLFFETLDGTLPLNILLDLAEAGSLQKTKILKFGQLKRVQQKPFKKIYTSMPQLKHLDLSNVCHLFEKKKEHPAITELEGLCPDLCELVFSQSDTNLKEQIPNCMFEPIIQIRGPNLVMLDFSGIVGTGIQKLFVHIANNCPNLEELLAQNLKGKTIGHSFPVDKMQNGCPKLKTLRLGFPIIFSKKSNKNIIGFPDLEVFTHPSRDDFHFKSSDLEALLSNSPNLKILDVRGCPLLTYEAIYSLPAVELEQMYISFTRIAHGSGVAKLFRKWSHSLNVIDVSHINGENINDVFKPCHLPNGLPNLEVLDVNSTAITAETLEVLVQQCPKLRFLNLQACRSIARGSRTMYHSRPEIEELLLKLNPTRMD